MPTEFVMQSVRMVCQIPEKNRNAFYNLRIVPDLFGFVLIRHWGRIGTRGRLQTTRFSSQTALAKEFNRLLRLRLRHQYTIYEA